MFVEQIKASLTGDALIKSMTITNGEFLDLFWESERRSREEADNQRKEFEECERWVIGQYCEIVAEMYRKRDYGNCVECKVREPLKTEGLILNTCEACFNKPSLWQRIKGWFR